MIVGYTSGSGNFTYTYTGMKPYPSTVCLINDGANTATLTINDVPAIPVYSGEVFEDNFEQFDTVVIAATSAWRLTIAR